MADITQEILLPALNAGASHQTLSSSGEPQSAFGDPVPAVFPGVDAQAEVNVAVDAGLQGQICETGNVVSDGVEVSDDSLTGQPVEGNQLPQGRQPLSSTDIRPDVDTKEDVASVVTMKSLYRLPNFTMGRGSSCQWKIPEGISFGFRQVKSENVIVDREDGNLQFRPLSAGEVKIDLPYNGGKYITFCMTVNPDPWSLWPNPPPLIPNDEEHVIFDSDKERLAKNHKTVIACDYPGLKVIGASRRGRSHERSATFRDDDMGVWADEANGNYVFIVSDGAGSCKYSREGALQSINFIKSKLDDNKDKLENAWQSSAPDLKPDCTVGMLLALLASKAKEYLASFVLAVNADGHECKLKDFSGTLLMVAMKKHLNGEISIVSFAIGDGAIAWCGDDGCFGLMNRPDSGEFGGGTRFLVTPEVWKTIFYPSKETPWTWNSFCISRVLCKKFSAQESVGLKLYLMSDGVSDPWFETDAGLENGKKWREFSEEILLGTGDNKAGLILSDSPETNAEKLWEWLYFKIVGNHDDRTLIMAYTTDAAKTEVCNG